MGVGQKLTGRRRKLAGMLASTAILVLTANTSFAQQDSKSARIASASPTTYSFAIAAKPLSAAIADVGAMSGWRIAYAFALPAGARSQSVSGTMTAPEAISRILAGTGLSYRISGAQSIVLVDPKQPASGEDADGAGATSLKPIVLHAESPYPSDPYAGIDNPPTSVGSKTPLAFKELPQTADVVTQKQLKEQNAKTLDEALKMAPGVTVFQSDADRVQYYSRGFPISSMEIDGVPVVMNPNMSGTASTNAPNLAMYDRVEVLDGPAGLYSGFGNPGGTLNLVRKRAPDHFQASAEATGGTRDMLFGTADIGGPINPEGTVRGRFVASGGTQDLNMDGRWRHDQSYYGTLEADLTPDTLARLGVSYSRRDTNEGWANKTPVYSDGTPVAGPSSYFGTSWNHDSYKSTDVFASVEHTFENDWKLSLNADYGHNDGSIYSGQFFTAIDPTTDTGIFGTTNKQMVENNVSFDANVSGDYDFLGRQSQATFGVNYNHMNNKTTTYYGSGTTSAEQFNWETVNVFDFYYPQQTFLKTPADTTASTTVSSQTGLYANTRVKLLDPLTFVVGGRLSWYKYEVTPDATYNSVNAAASEGSYDRKFTPYAALIYDIDKTYSVYTSYTSIFQPQYYQEKSGDLVKPIEGNQYEVGLKGTYLDGKVNTSIALFRIDQSNRSMLDPSDASSTYYIGTGKARTQGIDLRVSGEIADGWTLQAGYTYNNSKYLDTTSLDSTASGFTQIAPRHLFKLWTNYQLPGQLNQWEIGAGVNAVSELYYGSGTSKIVQKPYATADARIAYHFNDKTTLALNVSNLFDKVYYQPILNGVVYGDRRRAMLTLSAKF
ncbi:TonB-dependent receptor [Neorhizobium sp. NCHU2750]|uniref:TonB-dependent siderophore receptor n=1 Tax=Neorhizobium sp. NCHU2750 TaxID=1825976 RepID=UPI000E73B853|nr:outer-membrane receptor for ferric coprogen and ferric-rhodotorulic acid [Neorhizobium sp. NCHU2750]